MAQGTTVGSEGRIVTGVQGNLLLIGIDRSAKLNAFSPRMFANLAAAYDRLEADADLRCGVLYAEGANFTAGLDLPKFIELMQRGDPLVPADAVDPFGLRPPLRTKPLVVAVQGWCLTLGIELLLAADICIAADDTRFRQHEVARAVMPTGGATIRMVERAGWGNAMRWLLTGDEFDAAEALRLGFVQEVVPAGRQRERAVEIARTIAAQAPLAVRATRANALTSLWQGPEAAVAEFKAVQRRLAASEDAAEGVRAFRERRPGRFGGR